MGFAFAPGIYEALLSVEIADVPQRHQELCSVFKFLQVAVYALSLQDSPMPSFGRANPFKEFVFA